MVSDADLVSNIEDIIASEDLTKLTFKIIYHRLRLKYGHLSDRKKFLRETVLRIIEGEKLGRSSSANEEKDEQQEIATEEKNEENRSSKNLHSEMIGSVLDEKEFPMHLITQKELSLQKIILERIQTGRSISTRGGSSSKRKISTDLQRKKQQQKTQQKSSRNASEANDIGSNRDSITTECSSLFSEDNEIQRKKKQRKSFNALTRPTVLSPTLAAFLGEEELPRTEVVKRLHSYIRENHLQDSKNGRKINFDERLQKVFKCKSSDFFKINRLLSKHVKPINEVV